MLYSESQARFGGESRNWASAMSHARAHIVQLPLYLLLTFLMKNCKFCKMKLTSTKVLSIC